MNLLYRSLYTPRPFFSVLLHAFCWCLLILYELGTFYYAAGRLGGWLEYTVHYILNIGLFYGQYALLENTFNRKKWSYLQAFILFALQIAIALLLKFLFAYLYLPDKAPFLTQLSHSRVQMTLNLFRCLYFIAFATLFWSAGRIAIFRRRAEKSQLQQLRLQHAHSLLEARFATTENAYLHQQLNPHLLFNTLNFIYSSVNPHSADGGRCVLLLSDIMRFSLNGSDQDGKTALDQEVLQLHNLIAINQYRFPGIPVVHLEAKGDFEPYRIIPLVLLTLSENIFKHGDLKSEPALIQLTVGDGGYLTYLSLNRKKRARRTVNKKSTGLEHLTLRLNYAYPGRYTLNITENDDFFELTLRIAL